MDLPASILKSIGLKWVNTSDSNDKLSNILDSQAK